MAKVAIIVFPGSNCDRDAYDVVKQKLNLSVKYHWHQDPIKSSYKAVILPGGFSYGDYLRAGALAKISPAVQSLGEFSEKGGLVLGICNGFQILVEAGYLPGSMMKNRSFQFQCEDVFLRVESNRSPFMTAAKPRQVLRMPIAHSEGRYVVEDEMLKELEEHQQIVFRYCSSAGQVSDDSNANGSTGSIGGVTNRKGNVMGLMPHPERCADELLGNTDGLTLFRSMYEHVCRT